MHEEKDKLEKDLEFLKESFESEVISEDEFLSGRERIQKQIKGLENKKEVEDKKDQELETGEQVKKEEKKLKIKKEEIEIEENPEIEEVKEEDKINQELKAEIDKKGIKVEEHTKPQKEIQLEEVKTQDKEETQQTISESKKEEPKSGDIPIREDSGEIDIGKVINWKYLVIGLIGFIIIMFFIVPFFRVGDQTKNNIPEPVVEEFIACSSDNGCRQQGKIGICENPGTIDAVCKFSDAVKTELVIINTKECFNCDTTRVVNLLKDLYPGLYTDNLDYNSEEGNNLVNVLGIESLPAYIFDKNLSNTNNFDRTKRAFDEINDRFVMNKEASAASFFVDREEVPNKLDAFLTEESASLKAEANLKEFLNLFEDKIEFSMHSKNDLLTKELGIRTFPVFFINNKIKFTGVQSAEKIKENFCQLNKLDECSQSLSESLI